MVVNYKIWSFEFVFNHFEPTEKDLDKLYEAGCDDMAVISRGTQTMLQFDRPAFTLAEAMQGAFQDINAAKLNIEVDYIKIYPDQLK